MADAQATGTQAVVRNISDTARWAAVFRARETSELTRSSATPMQNALLGRWRGYCQHAAGGKQSRVAWVARTYLFDQFITQEIEQGTTWS